MNEVNKLPGVIRLGTSLRKMKSIISISFFIFLCFVTQAQNKNKCEGKYYHYSGDEIELKKDSSFKFTWSFDMTSSWSIGTWLTNNDTIYFKIIPVFDTLIYFDSINKTQIDTLVLSLIAKPRIISYQSYAIEKILAGQQNSYRMPSKLYYQNERLYLIDVDGKLIKKKFRSISSKNKYVPWYKKE